MSPRPPKQNVATKETPESQSSPSAPQRQLGKFIFVGAALLVLMVMGTATAYAFSYRDRYLPRTSVGGVAIGGLTQYQAGAALLHRTEQFKLQSLTLEFRDRSGTVTSEELGYEFSHQPALDALWAKQKTGGIGSQLMSLLTAPLVSSSADITLIDQNGDDTTLIESVIPGVEAAFQETSLALSLTEVKIVQGTPGEKLQPSGLEDAVARAYRTGDYRIQLQVVPSQPEVSPEMAEPARARAEALLTKPLVVVLGSQRYTIEPYQLAEWLATEVERDGNGQATGLRIAFTAKINPVLDEWIAKVNRAPVNVRLAVQDNELRVVAPDVDGRQVNRVQTIGALQEYLAGADESGTVTGTIESVKAPVREVTLADLGIKELVGTATTDYTGSPNNRKFNIAKGAAGLDRVLVRPGETFSTTRTLGPISEATGYLPELVIKGNRTIPEAGGGLCQVSTTLFRAVLNAGMPIVERQNHSYRVSYYEREVGPGLDATIYSPRPDFKWKNDLGSAVFVQSSIKDNKVTFELFGTRDGRTSTISSPTILERYPVGQPIYVQTDSLPRGETRQVERAHDGAKTSVTYQVHRDGKQIYSRTFISVYRAWPAQFLVGTR
jgi:vancomycin resistance protein YoaR